MRDDSLSEGHLRLCRRMSILIALGVIVVICLNIFSVLSSGNAQPIVNFGSVAIGAATLLLLYWGQAALKRSVDHSTFLTRVALDAARRDSLTGALTRAHFLETLKKHVYLGASEPVAYIQLDMDHLKVLNDGNGHSAGDAAIKQLVSKVRDVFPDAIIGRLGGDEFGVVVVGHSNKRAVQVVCEKLLEQLGRPFSIEGRHVELSATMGVAISPDDASAADDLIAKADLALDKGKAQGRACVFLFDTSLHASERYKRFIERELRAAILLDQLELHYQPIFAADGLTLLSYESLVRWNHPVRGMISPAEFIPLAEKSDLIDKLGEWVLNRACRDLESLAAPTLAVNVSAAQLKRPDFCERFGAILQENNVLGDRITVEITETVPLEAGCIELANLDALRRLNVRIAIDDFGAGNASLAYIKQFSFDVLKIDRSYVESVTSNRFDAMTVGAISRIARAGGMLVVAEGIETEQQRQLLARLGCGALQGFYLGRPEPLRKHLAQRKKDQKTAAAA